MGLGCMTAPRKKCLQRGLILVSCSFSPLTYVQDLYARTLSHGYGRPVVDTTFRRPPGGFWCLVKGVEDLVGLGFRLSKAFLTVMFWFLSWNTLCLADASDPPAASSPGGASRTTSSPPPQPPKVTKKHVIKKTVPFGPLVPPNTPPMVMPCWSGSPCTNQCFETMAAMICSTNTAVSNWDAQLAPSYCGRVANDIAAYFSPKDRTGFSLSSWTATCSSDTTRTAMMVAFFETVGGALLATATSKKGDLDAYEPVTFDDPAVQGLLNCLCPAALRTGSGADTGNFFKPSGLSCHKAKKKLLKKMLTANDTFSNPLASILWAYANSYKLVSMGNSLGRRAMVRSGGTLTSEAIETVEDYNQQLGQSVTNPFGFSVVDAPWGYSADQSALQCQSAFQGGNDPLTVITPPVTSQ